MNLKKIRPERNMVFSLRSIFTMLDLPGAPHLAFKLEAVGVSAVSYLQYAHMSRNDLLSNAEFAETTWKYSHTAETSYGEVPVFMYYPTVNPITHFINYEPVVGAEEAGLYAFWCTLKGFPCKQVSGVV